MYSDVGLLKHMLVLFFRNFWLFSTALYQFLYFHLSSGAGAEGSKRWGTTELEKWEWKCYLCQMCKKMLIILITLRVCQLKLDQSLGKSLKIFGIQYSYVHQRRLGYAAVTNNPPSDLKRVYFILRWCIHYCFTGGLHYSSYSVSQVVKNSHHFVTLLVTVPEGRQ